jgi:chromosome segregation ATPase
MIVAEASKRVTSIEDAQPAVEAALRDYTELNRSHEAIRDALEQVRVAEGEMIRVRDNQGEAQTWLADVTEAMGALRVRVKEVAGMKPAVDLVRSEVERVTHAMGSVESRREFLDEMNKRLTDLSSTASRLDERTKGLHSRMETADFLARIDGQA